MKDKVVCFAGHRFEWHNIGIEEKLEYAIIDLIERGFNVFYDGDRGYFDKISAEIIIKLKQRYPNIKIFRILSTYQHDAKNSRLPECYDGSILPDLDKYHYKQKLIKRNEWMIKNCDVVVCHIHHAYKSGAYKTIQFAQKIKKSIIYI